MCADNSASKLLKEGVVIDASFPLNMELAYELLIQKGKYAKMLFEQKKTSTSYMHRCQKRRADKALL